MEEAAVSEGVAHYPPGSPAPKAGDRIEALREPDRLAKLNEGKAEWYAKPLEERREITAHRQAEKARKAAEREAKRRAKNGTATEPPPNTEPEGATDSAPVTVRSQRATSVIAPPDSTIPRPGVRGAPLKGLLDLCEALPSLGDGTCFIQVSRVKPPLAFGIPCAGVQRPLWEPLDDAEFSVIYGGAEYVLRGYEIRENGRTKALTEPVTYKVAGPPNLESALTEEDAMRPQAHVPNGAGHGHSALRRPGLVTPAAATAEAEMHGRELQHAETMDDRNARRAEERRQRELDRERQERQETAEAARLFNERTEREVERTREMYEERLREKSGGLADMAELLKAIKPDGDQNKELLRQHTTEIKQLTEAHREQVSQLTESHQSEVRRLSEMHAAALLRLDDQMRADRERSDKLIRETDQRSHEQIREAERRADQRVSDAQNSARTTYEDLKARSEERLRDQMSAHTQRIEDMRDNFARDLKRKDDELVLMKTGLEGNVGIILGNKDVEIKRLERELREAKVAADNAKDWISQMKKAEEQAEALGFSRPEPGEGGEPEDMKTTLMKTGLGLVGQLPQIIDSASNALSKARGGNPQAPADFSPGQTRGQAARGHTRALPARGGPAPVVLAPLPFATEDGGYMEPAGYQAPPSPRRPAIQPFEQSPTQSVVHVPEQQLQLPLPQSEFQQNPTTPPEQAQNAVAPPQQQMAPVPQQSVAPAPSVAPPSMAPPPQGSGDELDPMTLGIIQGLAPDFAGAFVQRVQPDAVVQRLIADNGIENVRAALAIVTVDQVIAAMGADGNPQHAVLKTRNGQKFLRAIWQTAEKMVAQ